ncbi:zinc-ribbon domain-containing protein [bacterium]|nr:zinc-ribbon domain-containing protein [bacterium]
MITTCTECQARYQLDADKVPHRVIKVRCPGCRGVFTLDGTARPAEVPLEIEHGGFAQMAGAVPPTAPAKAPAARTEPVAAQPAAAGVAVLDRQETSDAGSGGRGVRRRRSKEEMYARALVSDILAYNRETRDKALRDGNLVEALGAEIKKSWELYKEKVTPEVANSSDHFRAALNEILADGAKVF